MTDLSSQQQVRHKAAKLGNVLWTLEWAERLRRKLWQVSAELVGLAEPAAG